MTFFIGTMGDDFRVAPDTRMYGLGGDDFLFADTGFVGAMLFGDDGDDSLWGSFGNDELYGGPGDDLIKPAGGADTIEGGRGHDTFHFSFFTVKGEPGPVSLGVSRILDFRPKHDTIVAESMGYADPDMIYRKKTGVVAIDFDGKGGLDPVKFARIDKHLKITDDDLVVA